MKKLLIAAGAIVALMAAAMVAVYLQSEPPAAPAPEAPPPPPPAQPASELPPQAQAETSRLPAVGAPPKPMAYAPLPPPPPPESWEAVKPVARLASLGPAGHALNRGLGQLGPQLGACFDEVTQSRYGQAGFTATKEADPGAEDGLNTVVILQVESLDGQVRIVDAPVETRGGASDGFLACAQSVLRGQTFAAPGVKAGSRMRVVYNLTP